MLACALLCAGPAHAVASTHEESVLMDDEQLIYASSSHMAQTLKEIKALGIDRVKVSIVWKLVAPDPLSRNKPSFDATNPAAYPTGAWQRWDQLVAWCRLLGLKVYFQIVPPAPLWATSGPTEKSGNGYDWSENPSGSDFAKFVEAVGRRYSGSYSSGAEAPALTPPAQLGTAGETGVTPTASDPAPAIQRVNYWGIWNEPNEPTWLSPQFKRIRGHEVDNSPRLYRALVDAGYRGLKTSGHGSDTILTEETASHGAIYPAAFARDVYCVDTHYRRLTGRKATDVGCPKNGKARSFVSAHPGLFAFPGIAYHPYSFDTPPSRALGDRNVVTLANLGEMETAIDRSRKAYGSRPKGGVAMYLTEWGYKTKPPNPFVKTSLKEQADWINEGEWLTYRMPRVRCLTQFLLVDNAPRAGATPGTRSYWSTFQSGLIFANGRAKPSLGAFRLPIWLPSAKHGSHVTVWGEFRPADHTGSQVGELNFKAKGSRRWKSLHRIRTGSSEGFFVVRVKIPSAGSVKLSWRNPANGRTFYSRVVAVR
jgi:hypothetical protein